MLFNFIKVTLRNIIANRVSSIINILGLAIGMACALVFTLFINHELRYDRFHSDYDSIYRVNLHSKLHSTTLDGATSSGLLAPYISSQSGIDDVTRITRLGAWLIGHDSIRYNEDNLLFVDGNFFSFFDGFKIIDGDIKTMLVEPRSIVLTESAAQKYFGVDTGLVGKFLRVETKDKPYKITGVVQNPPYYSHIQFDLLASMSTFDKILNKSWTSNNVYTYLKLKNKSSVNSVNILIDSLFKRFIYPELSLNLGGNFSSDDEYTYVLQPLANIHLNTGITAELGENSSALYVYSLAFVTILILLIACLNFINLSIANSETRSFEVGIRKIAGADRSVLVIQFIIESVVYSVFALFIALIITELTMPLFNERLGMQLEFDVFKEIRSILIIFLFTIALGVFSGSFLAFYITSGEPMEIFSEHQTQNLKGIRLRWVFVFFQIASATLITIFAVFSYTQVKYLDNKDLGFKHKDMLIIRRSDALHDKLEDFCNRIKKKKDVNDVTNTNFIPGRSYMVNAYSLKGEKTEGAFIFNKVFVGQDYFSTYELQISKGQFFDAGKLSDSIYCIINEAASKKIGLENPVGTVLESGSGSGSGYDSFKIVGVVKDFHYADLSKEIEPLIICPMQGNWEGYISVNLSSDFSNSTIAAIEREWYKDVKEYPFVYFMLDDDINENYKTFRFLSSIIILFCFLSIFMACSGFYGLISVKLNSQNQQIAVHRALGATLIEILLKLGFRLLNVVLFAVLFAEVIAYFLLRYWMQDFYYNVGVKPVFFIISPIIILVALTPLLYLSLSAVLKRNSGFSFNHQNE